MAIVIYPDIDWDSFCSVADADTLLTAYVPSTQRTAWDALSLDTDKEIYLRQATLLISQRIIPPPTLEDDLKLATAYLANYSIGVDMLNADKSSNVKIKDIKDVVRTEYFGASKSSNALPDIVASLLTQYGLYTNTIKLERA